MYFHLLIYLVFNFLIMFNGHNKNKYKEEHALLNVRNTSSGVTLVELLVVVSIFMVISSITIFSYGKFNTSLSIQNLADDIALTIRRAQGYAIGVRGVGYSSTFTEGYGIHLTANPTPTSNDVAAGSNKSFILFADLNNGADIVYNYNNTGCTGVPVVNNECLEVLSITTADKITEIRLIINNSSILIDPTDSVDIGFKRPNPEPKFCHRSGGGCLNENISSIKIKISTDANPEIFKMITISNNGQISVSN